MEYTDRREKFIVIAYSLVGIYSGTQKIIKGSNSGSSPFQELTYGGNEEMYRKTEKSYDTINLLYGIGSLNPGSQEAILTIIDALKYANDYVW
jgi:hypothetical protein